MYCYERQTKLLYGHNGEEGEGLVLKNSRIDSLGGERDLSMEGPEGPVQGGGRKTKSMQ